MGVELTGEMQIIRRIVAGETELFDTLYEKHHREVFVLAYRMCQSRTDAEEVVSEVFLKAYRGLKKFKGDSSLATWLYRITINESNNLLRRSRRQVPWDPDVPFPQASRSATESFAQVDEEMTKREEIRDLRQAMRELPIQDRLILTLRYDNELSYEEIAEVVHMPKNSVGTKIARAKKALMAKMKEN
ncbi:MAG: RNA polymerase sigma factor [Chitinophagales bacterium]